MCSVTRIGTPGVGGKGTNLAVGVGRSVLLAVRFGTEVALSLGMLVLTGALVRVTVASAESVPTAVTVGDTGLVGTPVVTPVFVSAAVTVDRLAVSGIRVAVPADAVVRTAAEVEVPDAERGVLCSRARVGPGLPQPVAPINIRQAQPAAKMRQHSTPITKP